MIPPTPCPDAGEFRCFLLGLPGGAAAAELEAHLAACPRCLRRAAELGGAGDALVEAVRGGPDDLAATPIPAGVMERLRGLGREAPPEDAVGPDRRVGPYRVESVLGRGGMGVVYLARHDRLSRPVAVKVLPAGATPERVARFRREAEAVAALRHPNVVQVFEVGDAAGRPFLAMEYVPGGSLATKLAAALPGPSAAARLVEAAARAVAAAHALGIVHRDLKPGNILLGDRGQGTGDREEPTARTAFLSPVPCPLSPVVADFGLAKYREPDRAAEFETESGALLGTPGYMAPEQATGEDAGPAADVYGLGAILYECLTGRPPFKAATVLETLDQVRDRDPVPPRRLEPAVPRDLETVCLKCLEKDPARRYASAAALADDLGRFLRGEPVQARPAGVARRAWKWACRRPAVAALIGVSAAAVVALVAVTVSYTARLRDAVKRAEDSADEARRHDEVAGNNYRSARGALRRIVRHLDDRRVADTPYLKELRAAQLEDALAFYEGVLAGLDDPDPAVRLDAAAARAEVGALQLALGRSAAALENCRRARDVFERLPPEFRTRPECRDGLIGCYNHLADLALAAGRGEEAEEHYGKALAEAGAAVADDPADPGRQDDLARAEHNLGVQFQIRGLLPAAEPHYRRAVAIRGELAARHPDEESYRAALAEGLLNLGLLCHQLGRLEEADQVFRSAGGLLRPLAAAHPGDDRYALSLAGLVANRGNLLRARGDLPGALAEFDRAVELADAVVAREPRHAVARRRSVEAHGSRALLREQLGRLADAVADWDLVVEMADDTARPGYRVGRAVQAARAGMHGRAAAEAAELARLPGLPDFQLYNLACALALSVGPAQSDPLLGTLAGAAAAEGHAAAAVALLWRLHAAGYFRRPGGAADLARDPDLDPLRPRPDFRRLLAEVAGGPNP